MFSASARADLRRWAGDGTLYVVGGTVVAAVGGYAFQVVGARALGAAAFDPVTALLTINFLAFFVLLLPVEQFEIRRMTLDRTGGVAAVGWTVALGVVGATAFTFLTRDHYFGGNALYAAIALVSVLASAVLALARGRLAGLRRFRAYGLVSGVVPVVRVALALLFLGLAREATSLGWALAVGPLVVLAWMPFRRVGGADRPREAEAGGRFLSGFVLASAASQVLLLIAPLAVGIISDEPGLMSIVFLTFQLFRLPVIMTQNLLGRLLPHFTSLVAAGRVRLLRRWAERFALGALVAVPLAAAFGGLAGPALVRLLYGAEFRPSWEVAALAAGGTAAAAISLIAGQLLVAQGRTMLLAGAWALGFLVAVAALLPTGWSPGARVSWAFLTGEVAALAAIVGAALRAAH